MGFKDWWTKLSYWKKGAFFGFVLGLLIYSTIILIDYNILIWWWFGTTPICYLFGSTDSCFYLMLFAGWIVFPIVYGLAGTILGLLIGNLRGK